MFYIAIVNKLYKYSSLTYNKAIIMRGKRAQGRVSGRGFTFFIKKKWFQNEAPVAPGLNKKKGQEKDITFVWSRNGGERCIGDSMSQRKETRTVKM
ncbi:hypothetical protein M378DRAFT_650016 [Amanita muscaria Koide BX008]|uniref:Uncharacterized protein n=1 Tax=Amanita muscaria (strain Koide BX008) TaxID=946122 RepID=A0A0C2WQ69_AMAMK|nr:hypothetical protein M378DRAFT_650016 [Amanita muscaria Koide BX008]